MFLDSGASHVVYTDVSSQKFTSAFYGAFWRQNNVIRAFEEAREAVGEEVRE